MREEEVEPGDLPPRPSRRNGQRHQSAGCSGHGDELLAIRQAWPTRKEVRISGGRQGGIDWRDGLSTFMQTSTPKPRPCGCLPLPLAHTCDNEVRLAGQDVGGHLSTAPVAPRVGDDVLCAHV